MSKLLLKLLTFLELAVGASLLILGISGFFSYFLFNALLGVMGFFILADGLGKIDDPAQRKDDDNHDHYDDHHRPGGGHRFGSGEPDSNNED